MNNGYNFNFMPNPAFARSMPIAPNYIAQAPRISPLFGRGAVASTTANTSKITFSGILNGASKTLGVINQAIPVFYQVKPIWNNARTMFRVVKGLNSSDATPSNKQVKQYSNTEVKKEQSNAPTFFA